MRGNLNRRNFLANSITTSIGLLGLNSCKDQERIVKRVFELSDGKRDIEISVWYNLASKNSPAYIFSHGFSASPQCYHDLAESIASEGGVFIAPQHKDYITFNTEDRMFDISNLDKLFPSILILTERLNRINGYEDIMWRDAVRILMDNGSNVRIQDSNVLETLNSTFDYRREEMNLAFQFIDYLNERVKEERSITIIDESKIGLIGHSLGGNTILRKITQDYDSRVRATVLYSSVTGLTSDSELETITIPTIFETGTEDGDFIQNMLRGFERVSGKSVYVNWKDVGHFTFSKFGCDLQNAIQDVLQIIDNQDKNEEQIEIEKIFLERILGMFNLGDVSCIDYTGKAEAIIYSANSFLKDNVSSCQEKHFLDQYSDRIAEYYEK